MCGIAGVYSFKSSHAVDRGRLGAALGAMAHRGPDGRDVFVSQCRRWGLAHALLGFTDLVGGAQPLWSADGRYAVVCNGEFYDYDAVFAAHLSDYARRTRSDSELVLALYARFGLGMLSYLQGEFAFALLDTWAGELLLVRDRFGVKPLHYAVHRDRLVFASEIKGIRVYEGPLTIDPEMAAASALLSTPADRTIFAGIRQVPPGHVLRVTAAGVESHRWFTPSYPAAAELAAPTLQEAAADTRAIVSRAVRSRLPGEGIAAAAYLSGGIDSSVVFTEMARSMATPVSAFTIRFAGDATDEAAEAAELVSVFGGRHYVLTLTDDDLAAAFETCLWHTESPISNHHATAKLLLNRSLRAAGFRCALSGEGADEMMLGYPSFLGDYYASAAPDVRAAWLARRGELTNRSLGVTSGNESAPAWLGAQLGQVPQFLGSVLRSSAADSSLWRAPDAGHDATRRMLHAAVAMAGPKFATMEPVTRAQLLWKLLVFPNYHLACLGDRVEMASSVEARLPFLDTALFDLARTMPATIKVGDGLGKAQLRLAYADVVGTPAATRPKRAFLAPDSLKMARMRALQLEILSTGDAALDQVFDRDSLRSQVAAAGSGRIPAASDRLMTRAVSLYALAKLFR